MTDETPKDEFQKAWDKIRSNSELPVAAAAQSTFFDLKTFNEIAERGRQRVREQLAKAHILYSDGESLYARMDEGDLVVYQLEALLKVVTHGVREVAATDVARAIALYTEFAGEIDMVTTATSVDVAVTNKDLGYTAKVTIGPAKVATMLDRLPALQDKWTDHRTYFGKDADCGGLDEETLRYYYRATRTWETPPTRQQLMRDLQDPLRQVDYLYPERIDPVLITGKKVYRGTVAVESKDENNG